jgi:hypothetical protein
VDYQGRRKPGPFQAGGRFPRFIFPELGERAFRVGADSGFAGAEGAAVPQQYYFVHEDILLIWARRFPLAAAAREEARPGLLNLLIEAGPVSARSGAVPLWEL